MRGLTGAGPLRSPGGTARSRGSRRAVSTATAGFAALALALSACSTGGTGTRDEGPAHASGLTGAAASPSMSAGTPARVNAVRLVQEDPLVSMAVKRDLRPCNGDEYPVDVSYGELTGGTVDDVVINVLTCGDTVGVGSYVYRREGGRYENVFRIEEPPVYAEIDRGDLLVTKQVYDAGDPVTDPSGEDVITYRWTTDRFVARHHWHNDYGTTARGGEPAPVPESN
ncbi:hypothetical protein RKD23_003382 [Streptomyces sp. SAI-170]|uniref:hypothetical protein n=1 Tax=Streptomyces sp. SAI-170 TaxID=3377729 RepID=UPI003C79C28D